VVGGKGETSADPNLLRNMNTQSNESPFKPPAPDTSTASEAELASPVEADFPRSTAMQQSPQLSSVALTRLLIGMCLIPIITILVLFYYMPPAADGELKCQFSTKDLPDQDFYAIDYRDRGEYELGELVVANLEEHDWTHLNILVNGHYQIYDKVPFPAGTSKSYKLDRFVSRAGAGFSLRYNELKSARIYARRDNEKHDRATWSSDFVDRQVVPTEQ